MKIKRTLHIYSYIIYRIYVGKYIQKRIKSIKPVEGNKLNVQTNFGRDINMIYECSCAAHVCKNLSKIAWNTHVLHTHLRAHTNICICMTPLYTFCCYSFIIRPKIEIDKLTNQVFNKNVSNQRGKKYCLCEI